MDYLTAFEISKKWNISSRMVAYYCEMGRVVGAIKKGKTWFIPAYAEKPVDKRYTKKVVKLEGNNDLQEKETKKSDINDVYHTKEVYNYLGFTRETLRYYEEIGLINPKRDRYSQYREFGFFDMARLLIIDFYRKRGFTPVEIKNLQKNAEPKEYGEALKEKISYLQNEINHFQRMLIRLKSTQEYYCYVTDNIGEFVIRTMPAYYVKESISSAESFDEYREKALEYLNLDNEDILSNMVRAITFDETGYKGSEMYIVNPFLESDKGNQKLVLGGGECLYTTLIADNNDNSVIEKTFVLCHKWAAEHQMSFHGVVYIFIRFVILNKQTDKNYYEVWLPLK